MEGSQDPFNNPVSSFKLQVLSKKQNLKPETRNSIGGRNSMDNDKGPVFVKDPNKTYGLMEIVDGTSPMVEKAPEDTVDTFPHYIILLTICSLAVTLALLVISLVFDAPLEELANPFI